MSAAFRHEIHVPDGIYPDIWLDDQFDKEEKEKYEFLEEQEDARLGEGIRNEL